MRPGRKEEGPLPGPDDIKAVLEFLPLFESPEFVFAKLDAGKKGEDGAITMPYWVMSDEANRFHDMLYDRGFIRPFNWVAWRHEAKRLVDDPATLAQANLETICRLLTTHVRQERFCEGYLQAMYNRGHLTAIFRRLASLGPSG